MSGTLRVVTRGTMLVPHDHVDVTLDDGNVMRFRDPRRFGAILWTRSDPLYHPLLAGLGPEPLGNEFSGAYLFERSRSRRAAIKQFLMDGRIVVGVGNIYASEALHLAGIHPARAAGRIALERYERLANAIRRVLQDAIGAGGTSLRDFVNELGRPGYFARSLRAYDRAGEPCLTCGKGNIRQRVLGQRSSYFCAHCQH
jgi:formamidopyrimidine-DNA glycosylase